MILTAAERGTVEAARRIAGCTGPDAVRELTGEADTALAYPRGFGMAQAELGHLIGIIERLTGEPAPRSDGTEEEERDD